MTSNKTLLKKNMGVYDVANLEGAGTRMFGIKINIC